MQTLPVCGGVHLRRIRDQLVCTNLFKFIENMNNNSRYLFDFIFIILLTVGQTFAKRKYILFDVNLCEFSLGVYRRIARHWNVELFFYS